MPTAIPTVPAAMAGIGDGFAAAWQRLWSRCSPAGSRAGGQAATRRPASAGSSAPGLTYRGYLGTTGAAARLWISAEQLRETEALLKTAAAMGRLGAWALEVQEERWFWSDEIRAIHEVGPEFEPDTSTVLSFYDEAHQHPLRQAFADCARHGTAFDLEVRLTTPSGRRVWLRVMGSGERGTDGRIATVRGAAQDITRFRSATDEAQRTAQHLTRTLETLGDGYVLLDAQWRFVYLNPEAARVLNRRRDELQGRTLVEEFPEVATGRFMDQCRSALRTGSTVEFERFYRPLGIWVAIKVSPSPQGITLCIRDDTERIAARREILQLKAQLAARCA